MTDTQQTGTERQEFVVSRTLNAPRDLVFEVWSRAEHLARWWGPKGCAITVKRLEFRPGGIFHYSMDTPDGGRMWGRFEYGDINPTDLIVFVNSFADEEGNIIRAPFSEIWPLRVLNRLTLDEQDGRTTLTLRGGPIDAGDEEWEMFHKMFPSMQQGFAGTLDQLEAYLASEQGA